MDAGLVEELLDLPGHVHVVVDRLGADGRRSHLEVAGGDHPPANESPDVEFVDGGDSSHCGHQPVCWVVL